MEERKRGQGGGWRDRGGGGRPRSSGTQGEHSQWGNNDMKGPSWRSHTALAHLKRHKISWPLHTHTHLHSRMRAHINSWMHIAHTYTKIPSNAMGDRKHSQRLHNKEKSVTRTSKHSYHHSSAYTDWPLLTLLTVKHNTIQTRKRKHTNTLFLKAVRKLCNYTKLKKNVHLECKFKFRVMGMGCLSEPRDHI